MCFLYAFIILLLVFIVLYILNFQPVNMEDEVTLTRFGGLYEHIKYKQESKAITNEAFFRTLIKIMMAALHSFGFINAYGICITGICGYLAFGLYLIASFRIDGLYNHFYYTFKMILFHFVLSGNYAFAIFQISKSSQELIVVSFFIQLINNIMIIILLAHVAYTIKIKLKEKKQDKINKMNRFNMIYADDNENENLDVSLPPFNKFRNTRT